MSECFRDGKKPYKGMKNAEVLEAVPNGYRIGIPDGVAPELYQIVLQCWAASPSDRPGFAKIAAALAPFAKAAAAAANQDGRRPDAAAGGGGGGGRYLDVQPVADLNGGVDANQVVATEDEDGYTVPVSKMAAARSAAVPLAGLEENDYLVPASMADAGSGAGPGSGAGSGTGALTASSDENDHLMPEAASDEDGYMLPVGALRVTEDNLNGALLSI